MEVAPVVSVLLPVYNGSSEYLREAVASILAQTFTDFELIIIDDGSNEETKMTLEDCTQLSNKYEKL
jgi:glycosyltransferase involved in cell wall biosynthesis